MSGHCITISAILGAAVLTGCSETRPPTHLWSTSGRGLELAWWETIHPIRTTTSAATRVPGDAEPPLQPPPTTIAEMPIETSYVVLSDVLFDPDSAEISAEAQTVMAQFVADVLSRPFALLTVHGHTDCRGNNNKELSVQRAEAAINQLIALGIDPTRLAAPQGHGCDNPPPPVLGASEDEMNRISRRVEFVVTTNP